MNDRFFTLWFAGRGYMLALLFGVLIRVRMHNEAPLRWEFLLLVAFGMMLRLWAGAHLGSHGNAMQTQSPTLCSSGPYHYSRNPLYIANILTGIGLILFANCLLIWIVILISIVLINHHLLLIHWEEKQLVARWNGEYETYLHTTSRWLGRSRVSFSGLKKISPQWNKVWIWQGRNMGYTLLCVLLIWITSKW